MKLDTLPPSLSMDYQVILNKPFYLQTLVWGTGNARKTRITSLKVPGDVLSNALAQIPFEASVLSC